jgi:hypothetical protein
VRLSPVPESQVEDKGDETSVPSHKFAALASQ